MALKLAVLATTWVVVLALIMGHLATAEDEECGRCSQKCMDGCASGECKICESNPESCDTCDALVWKPCATECYSRVCIAGRPIGRLTQCPLLTTTCSACNKTCASLCDDAGQSLCSSDCLPPTGSASSTKCDSCKASQIASCTATCQANICTYILSCPPVAPP